MGNVNAYRCSRTGVLFPDDYVENWGRKYGRGLGPVPVSEAIVNAYNRNPTRDRDGKMAHPVANCSAQVDFVTVTEEEFISKAAILHLDDRDYRKRGELMRYKGLAKEGSRVSMLCPELVADAKRILADRAATIKAAVQVKK